MKLLTLDYQGMAVYASREAWFNAVGCVLMGSYYPAPETRPKAGFTALLHGLAKPCRNLTVAGVLYRQIRLPERKPQQAIDNHRQRQQNKPVVLNRTASFDRLIYRQTSRRYSNLSGIFTSAHHATSAPFSGGQWQGGYTPAGSVCRSVNPAICLPPHTFDSVTAALLTISKGHIMTTRKAFSRPIIAHPLRTFPNLIQASAFVDRLTAGNAAAYRFNIQQTVADAWTVARVVSGGAV